MPRSERKAKVANIEQAARLHDVMALARRTGLLEGTRTELVRGRMTKALVERAKAKTGVHSDSKLIEIALANLAVADDFAEWLISQRGSIAKDINLEF